MEKLERLPTLNTYAMHTNPKINILASMTMPAKSPRDWASDARQWSQMADEAEATGQPVNGWTEEQLREKAERAWLRAGGEQP